MQTQILPLGRCMPHVSGRNVRRLLRSTTREFNSRLPNWEQACCKKGIFTCLARNHAYGGKLGIVFVAHIQDAWWFEFLMHAYVNKHECFQSSLRAVMRARRCIHICVVFIMAFNACMHACVCVCMCICARIYMYGSAACTYVHANTHTNQLKSQGRACQTKATQRSVCQAWGPYKKQHAKLLFLSQSRNTHTHAHTRKDVQKWWMHRHAWWKRHTHKHALARFQRF
jgi:hypothetical protein